MIELWPGDCLHVLPLIADNSVDMVMCDLPYGTTACKWDTIIPLDFLWSQYRRVCKPNAAIVLTAAQPFTSVLVMSNSKNYYCNWIWRKEAGSNFLQAKRMPLRDCEDILVFGKPRTYNPQMIPGKPYKKTISQQSPAVYNEFESIVRENNGYRYPKQVLDFSRSKDRSDHPTQKPVALMEYLIRTYTHEGMTVLDNCMGSGTTGVACVNTNRQFIGIEQDPDHFKNAEYRIATAQAERLIYAT